MAVISVSSSKRMSSVQPFAEPCLCSVQADKRIQALKTPSIISVEECFNVFHGGDVARAEHSDRLSSGQIWKTSVSWCDRRSWSAGLQQAWVVVASGGTCSMSAVFCQPHLRYIYKSVGMSGRCKRSRREPCTQISMLMSECRRKFWIRSGQRRYLADRRTRGIECTTA